MQTFYEHMMQRGWIVAGLFGAIMFLIVGGPQLLDVTNAAWAYERNDISAVQTGWTYYRYAPWTWPIAENPTYGMDFSGSILFSDAVPLMAIPFKALSPILPETFQYLGLWVLASFVLQGVFGWVIMSKITENPMVRILGAFVFSVTPLYIFRLTSCPHMSLTAHWLLLAAINLCLPPHTRRSGLWWGVLLAATAFVHVYTFAMVATLWCADLARRFIANWRTTWIEPLGVTAFVAALVLGSGVWSGPSGVFQGGFTWFKMNVFSFIDPNGWIEGAWDIPHWGTWSYIMPDIPNWGGDYEGFAYVGLGGLLLFAAAAWALPGMLRQVPLKQTYPYAPLALVLIGMAIFAASQNVTFGTFNLWLWWPEPLRKLGELFRATGRFIWPLYYVMFIVALFLVSRRLSPRTAIAALAAVVVIQAIDISPGWRTDRAYLDVAGGLPPTTLTSPFWDEAGERYDALRLAPHANAYKSHANIALMAFAHGLETDAVYLSRASTSAGEASAARIAHGLSTGEWPADTLFIITDKHLAQRIAATLDRSANFLGRVDDVVVLAPGWTGCADCGAAPF